MRQPQYTKDHTYRIISLPNGQWRLQRATSAQGNREFDPWANLSHPVDYGEACALLRQHDVVPAKTA